MNIPEGFKLVPVELIARAIAATMAARGPGSPTERDLRAALAAPAPSQPIYDDSKERELFEKIISKRGFSTEKVDGFYSEPDIHHAWSICLEFAQSRAKSVEVGHE